MSATEPERPVGWVYVDIVLPLQLDVTIKVMRGLAKQFPHARLGDGRGQYLTLLIPPQDLEVEDDGDR